MNDTQSPQAGSGKVEVTLLDILKLLLSKSYWLLLAGVLAGACVFLVTTFLITPSYESRVSFYVYNSSNNSVQSGTINNGDLQAAESLADLFQDPGQQFDPRRRAAGAWPGCIAVAQEPQRHGFGICYHRYPAARGRHHLDGSSLCLPGRRSLRQGRADRDRPHHKGRRRRDR